MDHQDITNDNKLAYSSSQLKKISQANFAHDILRVTSGAGLWYPLIFLWFAWLRWQNSLKFSMLFNERATQAFN